MSYFISVRSNSGVQIEFPIDFKVIMEKVFGLAMMLSRGIHFVVTAVGDTGSDRYDQPLNYFV